MENLAHIGDTLRVIQMALLDVCGTAKNWTEVEFIPTLWRGVKLVNHKVEIQPNQIVNILTIKGEDDMVILSYRLEYGNNLPWITSKYTYDKEYLDARVCNDIKGLVKLAKLTEPPSITTYGIKYTKMDYPSI